MNTIARNIGRCEMVDAPSRKEMQMTPSDAIARGYDRVAPIYDAMLAQDCVAVWMREQLWSHYTQVFPQGARVLDFTAGTGVDALYLAGRGFDITALDVSAGMLAELKRRAAERNLMIDARVLSAERLDELDAGDFDGAISGFAGLNMIHDLPRLSANLARLLKPRGVVILHALNAFCLWNAIQHVLHGQVPRKRAAHTQVGGESIAHQLYEPFDLYRQAYAREFFLREVYALSVLAAPTWIRRVGTFAPFILKIDRQLGRVARSAGDFFVMDLERRATRR